MSRRLLATVLAVLLSACGGGTPAEDESSAAPGPDLEELRLRVAGIRSSVEARLATETILPRERLREADVTLRVSTPMLLEIASRVVGRYLERVRLDLRPDVVVREGAEVRVAAGPLRIRAGRWDLELEIRRIGAELRAAAPELSVDESRQGLRILLPVRLLDASGDAEVRFRWDAATVARAVCRDFEVQEVFSATVAPAEYRLDGRLALRPTERGVVLEPVFGDPLLVRPEPTQESWSRVRELLRRQDRIFRCGLALDAEEMEGRLRDLLREGFRFRLPQSILQPFQLPAGIAETVTVGDRAVRVGAVTAALVLEPAWLWYGLDVTFGE